MNITGADVDAPKEHRDKSMLSENQEWFMPFRPALTRLLHHGFEALAYSC